MTYVFTGRCSSVWTEQLRRNELVGGSNPSTGPNLNGSDTLHLKEERVWLDYYTS